MIKTSANTVQQINGPEWTKSKLLSSRYLVIDVFPAFGPNTERYEVCLRYQSDCGKIRTRKTPNTDTFHAVNYFTFLYIKKKFSLSSISKNTLLVL